MEKMLLWQRGHWHRSKKKKWLNESQEQMSSAECLVLKWEYNEMKKESVESMSMYNIDQTEYWVAVGRAVMYDFSDLTLYY